MTHRARGLAALLVAGLVGAVASGAGAEPILLRYELAPGQLWLATHSSERETRLGERARKGRGVARFEYRVRETPDPERVGLDAAMLSQETDEGESPFDFSAIRFHARLDARGVKRGIHFEIGEAEPPELPGVERDPAAFRQMLRSVAEAWIDAVYWMPVLPERALGVGDSFDIASRDDVGGAEPGVRMEHASRTRFTLRGVEGDEARFTLAVRSSVDAEAAEGAVTSQRVAEGEAVFDLGLGMWTRHVTRSRHHARLRGADGTPTEATAITVTTIEMTPRGGPGSP